MLSSLSLKGGDGIYLYDTLGRTDLLSALERATNMCRVSAAGVRLWRVHSDFDADSGPFTQMKFEKERLIAYRWDGGEYAVNMDNGEATPLALTR